MIATYATANAHKNILKPVDGLTISHALLFSPVPIVPWAFSVGEADCPLVGVPAPVWCPFPTSFSLKGVDVGCWCTGTSPLPAALMYRHMKITISIPQKTIFAAWNAVPAIRRPLPASSRA